MLHCFTALTYYNTIAVGSCRGALAWYESTTLDDLERSISTIAQSVHDDRPILSAAELLHVDAPTAYSAYRFKILSFLVVR